MTALWRVPQIVYNPGVLTTLTLTIPMKFWQPESGAAQGGFDVVPSGVGEAYVVRWQELVNLGLRFRQSEYQAVHDWWKWSVSSMLSYTFTFDTARPGDGSYLVYTERPTMTDGFKPDRDESYPGAWTLQCAIRAVDNVTLMNPVF
jgi:hypothetical protein